MISMHHRLEVLNDWLIFLSTYRAIRQDKKDHLWSVKRCQFQEEGHLPSLGHFWRVLEAAGHWNESSSSSS